ncbi:hypothetical protein E2C01_007423 [Portunus trituberculatus]|uniref:Uncharacterized protein n=1 Tax=Portunus trituberculatus TaxID=210409 RepID=A0A5B7D050_PORTR|nr:hypothetical protein [Portunus trituberculatus]
MFVNRNTSYSMVSDFDFSQINKTFIPISFTQFYLQMMAIITHNNINWRQMFYMSDEFICCGVISSPGDMRINDSHFL